MEFEKQHLTEFKIREVWTLFGLFTSDNCVFFKYDFFSFLPKKVEIKETQYRIRYLFFDDGWSYKHYWTAWDYRYKFNK